MGCTRRELAWAHTGIGVPGAVPWGPTEARPAAGLGGAPGSHPRGAWRTIHCEASGDTVSGMCICRWLCGLWPLTRNRWQFKAPQATRPNKTVWKQPHHGVAQPNAPQRANTGEQGHVTLSPMAMTRSLHTHGGSRELPHSSLGSRHSTCLAPVGSSSNLRPRPGRAGLVCPCGLCRVPAVVTDWGDPFSALCGLSWSFRLHSVPCPSLRLGPSSNGPTKRPRPRARGAVH